MHWIYKNAADVFWSEEYWLPQNHTWKDVEPTKENQLPNYWDLWTYTFIIAMFLLILNYISTKFIFIRFANYLGINCTKSTAPKDNKLLEKQFAHYKAKVPHSTIAEIAKKLEWKRRDVERWIRQREASNRLSDGEKFSQTTFYFLFHSFYNVFGFVVLWQKEWLLDVTLCYEQYPHRVPDGIWWYYMLALGEVWFSLIRQALFSTVRKDALIDYLHHIFSIALMVLSWTMNLVRLGTIVLILHHLNDIFLLSSKMAKYAKKKSLTIILFVCLLISWLITRLFLFPLLIIKFALVDGSKYICMPVARILYTCASLLCILDIIWFGMLIVVAYRIYTTGEAEDVRSSWEDDVKNCTESKEK